MTRRERQMIYDATNDLIQNTHARTNDPRFHLYRIERSVDYFMYAADIANDRPKFALELLKVLDRAGLLADKPFTGEPKLVKAFRSNSGFIGLARKHGKPTWKQ